MGDTRQSAASGGIGLSGALFILFLALQLTGHIDWAWHWVAAPLWMPVGLVLAIVLLVGGSALVYDWFRDRRIRKARAQRAQGNPATTASIDRMTSEWANDIARKASEKRDNPFMRGPK